MPALHDEPSAGQLVEAVREFLEGDVMAATEGRVQFHARVAARVLAMVERELSDDELARRIGHAARLLALGVTDDAELAAAIREGELDGRPLDGDWLAAARASVWADVVAKLTVANPAHLHPEDT